MLNLDISQIIIQIIAFLVMLWVMKRYGWQPLLDILEARRKKIQAELDSIAAQKEQMDQLSIQYQEKIKEIDAEVRKKMQEAVLQSQKMSSQIQKEAQLHAQEILQRAKSEMESEIAKAKNQLKNDIVNLVIHATEKILKEKLDDSGQRELITKFIGEAQVK